MTQKQDYRSDWEKRFDEKFSNEIFSSVAIQIKRFISAIRVEAVGRGYLQAQNYCSKCSKELTNPRKER